MSYRLYGLCELYKKTNDFKIRDRIEKVVAGLMNSRNIFTGININDWSCGNLWSSKCYSIDNSIVDLICDDCEILSALLIVCNEDIIKDPEIVKTAIKAYEFYDQWYKDGHYYIAKGCPMQFDGLVVPWNWQNSMAEVCLGLFLETGEIQYLVSIQPLFRRSRI